MRVQRAGRVHRVVDDNPPGTPGDGRGEISGRQLETIVLIAGRRDRRAAREGYLAGVGLPARTWNNHLVAGTKARDKTVGDGLRRSVGDDDFRKLVTQPVLPAEMRSDGILQLRGTIDVGIAGIAASGGSNRSFHHMGRRGKIEIARREINDLAALLASLPHLAAKG